MKVEDIKTQLNLDELKDQMAEVREICIQSCSAKNGEGIWEGIGLLQQAMDNDNKMNGNMSLRND